MLKICCSNYVGCDKLERVTMTSQDRFLSVDNTWDPPRLQCSMIPQEIKTKMWGETFSRLSNHSDPVFKDSLIFPHISGIHCTNLIDHLNALVIMFSALSNFDFVTKFAVKNQNKETRKFMEAFDMKIQKRWGELYKNDMVWAFAVIKFQLSSLSVVQLS